MKSDNLKIRQSDNAQRCVAALRERGLKLAVAESCTGGGIGFAVTSVPGASDVFEGGVISYSNAVKMKVLGVEEAVLRDFGAVSAECARQMAEGAARLTGADVAVAVTGVAGPGGGSAEKPVGTVWFGIKRPGRPADAVLRRFSGDREAVRAQTINFALELAAGC